MTSEPELVVARLRLGPFWNFSYVIGTAEGAAAVIDPAWDVPALLSAAAEHGLRITHALVTHGHHDHVHGLAELVAATDAAVVVHHADAELVRESFDGPLVRVEHGHTLTLDAVSLTLLHTPGHTRGSLSVLAGSNLFTGDTLMCGGVGRHGYYPDAAAELLHSIAVVLAGLPPDTTLYPGHDAGPTAATALGPLLQRIRGQ